MSWQTLSLHFKQTYEGGYRYLDRCGEFMIAAHERLNCVPGEAKPSGGKMEIPERGVNITFGVADLGVSQELLTEDASYFVNLCRDLAALGNEIFQPKSILRNGFAWKSYWPFPNANDLLSASLKAGQDSQNELAKSVGMVSNHKKLDYFFSSGSKELHVVVQPVTFERVTIPKQNANYRANRVEKSRVDRFNQFAGKVSASLSHALALEVDLMENDPPAKASFEAQFDELRKHNEVLRKQFTVQ